MSNTHYGQYLTRRFEDIWSTPNDPNDVDTEGNPNHVNYAYFIWFYEHCGVPDRLLLKEASASTSTIYDNYDMKAIWFLLHAKYASSHIAYSSEVQFKLEIMRRIYSFAPQWQREMAVNDVLLKLEETDILAGYTNISNHATNPETEPTTQTINELTYIDDQSVTRGKKDKISGYSASTTFLQDDLTNKFLDRFKDMFLTITEPDYPLLYCSEEEDD